MAAAFLNWALPTATVLAVIAIAALIHDELRGRKRHDRED